MNVLNLLLRPIIHRLAGKCSMIAPARYPVWWANAGWLTRLAAQVSPVHDPAIVIFSLPRSGSSWTARMLTFDEQVLYLREPFTRTSGNHLDRNTEDRFPVREFDPRKPPQGYLDAARKAFAGNPAFPKTILQDPARWTLEDREQKRVLIKDVNPLAAAWLSDQFQPLIVYLLRHPAAVALSYQQRGWLGPKLTRSRFRPQTLSYFQVDGYQPVSFWEEMGIFQALVQRMALENLVSHQVLVVRYEKLCAAPLKEFQSLYEQVGLTWGDPARDGIRSHTTQEGVYQIGGDSLHRDSSMMTDHWKGALSREAKDDLQRGYFALDPPYYRDQAEW